MFSFLLTTKCREDERRLPRLGLVATRRPMAVQPHATSRIAT